MAPLFGAEKIRRRPPLDKMLLSIILMLLGLGLVMLFSASYFRATTIYGDPLRFFVNQSIYALVGLVGLFVITKLDLAKLRAYFPMLLLFSLLLMLLTFLPGLGAEFLGGRRWISFAGFSFQPSELVKMSLVLYLASVLDKKQDHLHIPSQGLVPPFLVVFVFVALIFLQNNFSTALFVLVLALSVFFVAGVKYRYFALTFVITLPLALFGLFTREHRLERLLTYIKPQEDPMGSGYQILASLNSLKQGGFTGAGIGQGVKKLGTLPEAQSDFIFAVLGEELGFLGVCAVIGLFAVFAWRGYRNAFYAPDLFSRLLGFGLTTSILLQSMINFAVVSSLIPSTGLPLPFFSSGGSSLLITLLMCGFLLNLSRQEKQPEGAAYAS